MTEAKCSGTTMLMDEKSNRIIAHGYLLSVVCLLTGLAFGVGSCASTVNPQNTPPVATGSSQTSSRAQASREGTLTKQELPEGSC
jgi:hypothetical protein